MNRGRGRNLDARGKERKGTEMEWEEEEYEENERREAREQKGELGEVKRCETRGKEIASRKGNERG